MVKISNLTENVNPKYCLLVNEGGVPINIENNTFDKTRDELIVESGFYHALIRMFKSQKSELHEMVLNNDHLFIYQLKHNFSLIISFDDRKIKNLTINQVKSTLNRRIELIENCLLKNKRSNVSNVAPIGHQVMCSI